jgi:hypothetical protein
VIQSSFMLTTVQPNSLALPSDFSAPLVVVIDEQEERGSLQHLDAHVGVAAGEQRKPAGLGEDVLGLAGTDVDAA